MTKPTSPAGPVIAPEGSRPPHVPVDERWSDGAFKAKLSSTHTPPAELNPYRLPGGEKLK